MLIHVQTVPLNTQVVQLINHIWPPLFEMYESEDNKYAVFAAAVGHCTQLGCHSGKLYLLSVSAWRKPSRRLALASSMGVSSSLDVYAMQCSRRT